MSKRQHSRENFKNDESVRPPLSKTKSGCFIFTEICAKRLDVKLIKFYTEFYTKSIGGIHNHVALIV